MHGGAQMQFSAIPMNLMGLKSDKKAVYFETGNFAKLAAKEAGKYGTVIIGGSGADTNYDRIPVFDKASLDPAASYAYITSNNTIYGTRWSRFPDCGDIPLVVDATSEILSRVMDYKQFGLIFAGAQKNLGPSGLAMTVIRKDLLGKQQSDTPKLLDYTLCAEKHSLINTINTFAVYVVHEVLTWLKGEGGVAVMEQRNEEKADLLYRFIDRTDFYTAHAQPQDRSIMNVTFNLPSPELLDRFLKEAAENGLYALKGHRNVGGARASIYNAMPREGVEALVAFMDEFSRKNG
jgi:phosphoserine aminotransferase